MTARWSSAYESPLTGGTRASKERSYLLVTGVDGGHQGCGTIVRLCVDIGLGIEQRTNDLLMPFL